MVQRFPSLSILSVVSSTTKSDSQSQKSSSRQRSNQLQPQLPLRKNSNVAKFPLPHSERTFLRPVPPKKKTAVPRVFKHEIPKFQSHRSRHNRREELARLRKLTEKQPRSSARPQKRSEKTRSFISPSLLSKKSPVTSPQSSRSSSLLLYTTRMLILGVGIAVIIGTILSILSSGSSSNLRSQAADNEAQTHQEWKSPSIVPLVVQQTREITALKTELDTIIARYPKLRPGVFLIDTDTGSYVDINGDATIAAASTIKLPILVAFFQAVDQGRIKLDDMLTMEESHIAEGSGNMRFRRPGTQYRALRTVRKMIIISDNTATNMLIEELGGAEVLNQLFQSWGLKNTVINNPLPDLSGTNTTTPKDLINLISQVNQGGLVSLKSRDRLFGIMEKTQNDSLLPRGIGRDSVIAHKTGNLKSVLADVGMIDLVNGKRYLLAILAKRPDNDQDAVDLIRGISKKTYQYLKLSQ
ncbi:MAG: class A beta-lactamase-related serine hydrolase [Trichodesmium sp. MAG_R03]|nr:class A beta-lactamase-related serine hydrolase [Trichodesmium sp. MAG_R03]